MPRFPNVVVTRTFSKAHGLAGLRLGYAIGDPRVIATVDKTLLPFAVNSLAQVAALAAIEHEDAIAARVKGILAERARVEGELAGAGWKLPDHQGNFVWLRTGDATDAVGLGARTSWRRGAAVLGRRRARHDRHAGRERPLPHRACGGRRRRDRPRVTPGDSAGSAGARHRALFVVVVVDASPAYLFGGPAPMVERTTSRIRRVASSLPKVALFAVAAGSVAIAAGSARRARHWATFPVIEAVAASRCGGDADLFRATWLRWRRPGSCRQRLMSIGASGDRRSGRLARHRSPVPLADGESTRAARDRRRPRHRAARRGRRMKYAEDGLQDERTCAGVGARTADRR